MAELVLGIGTSHALIKEPGPEPRLSRGERVRARLDPALVELPRPELESDLTAERCEQQLLACNIAARALGDVAERADVDTMLVVSNLHGQPQYDFKTIFGIYTGETIPVAQLPRGNDGVRGGDHLADYCRVQPGASDTSFQGRPRA